MDRYVPPDSKSKLANLASIGAATASKVFPSLLTIPLVILQAIILMIVVIILLVKKYKQMSIEDPSAKDIPGTSRAIFIGVSWGVVYLILGLVLNLATAGLFGILGFLIFVFAGIAYAILRNTTFAPKDIYDKNGEAVSRSDFSYWCVSFGIVYALAVIIAIAYGIVSFYIAKKAADVILPAATSYATGGLISI